MLDKLREGYLLKHGVTEKYIVAHLLEVVEILASNLFLKKGEVQNKSKQFMVLHCHESLRDKIWKASLIKK